MNKTEHLLVCLGEEAAEIQQAVAKALRFGLADGYPGTDRTNGGDIALECQDLIAVLELLEEEGIIDRQKAIVNIEAKKARVKEYMEYAKNIGSLSE